MLKKITHENNLLALIVSDEFDQPGIHFLTQPEFSQQLAYMHHPKGQLIQPHVHNPVPREVQYTQEVLFIKRGKLRVDFYTEKQDYRGASLLAMAKLSKDKGYRLVGSHRYGFNCFFMRNDVGENFFPEVSVESCHNNPYTQLAQNSRWQVVKDLNWQKV